MIKKNINNSFKVKWSSPPFSRIIKFSEFEIREKKQIKLNLDKKEIKLLERFLEIKSIRTFNCIINILPLGDDWEVNGKISMTCNLQCIISLEDLKYKLCIPIKRYLSSIQNKKIDKFIKYEDINSDIDPLTESIDLGDIISEELYLAIPKYPKHPISKIFTWEEGRNSGEGSWKKGSYGALLPNTYLYGTAGPF